MIGAAPVRALVRLLSMRLSVMVAAGRAARGFADARQAPARQRRALQRLGATQYAGTYATGRGRSGSDFLIHSGTWDAREKIFPKNRWQGRFAAPRLWGHKRGLLRTHGSDRGRGLPSLEACVRSLSCERGCNANAGPESRPDFDPIAVSVSCVQYPWRPCAACHGGRRPKACSAGLSEDEVVGCGKLMGTIAGEHVQV